MSKRLSVIAAACAAVVIFAMSGCGDSSTGTSGGGSGGSGGGGGDSAARDAARKADEAKAAWRDATVLYKEMQHRYAAMKDGQEKFMLWPPFGPEVKSGMGNDDVKKIAEDMAEYFPEFLATLADKYQKGEPNGPHSEEFKKMLADPEFPKLKELKDKVMKLREEQKLQSPGPDQMPARLQYETGKALMFYSLLPMIEDEKGTAKTLSEDQRKEAIALYEEITRMIRAAINEDRMSKLPCVPERYQREPYQKALDHVIAVLKPDADKGKPKAAR